MLSRQGVVYSIILTDKGNRRMKDLGGEKEKKPGKAAAACWSGGRKGWR